MILSLIQHNMNSFLETSKLEVIILEAHCGITNIVQHRQHNTETPPESRDNIQLLKHPGIS